MAPENKILWIFRSKSSRISPSDGLCESAPKPYSICKWSKTNQCVQIGFKKMERSSKSRGLYYLMSTNKGETGRGLSEFSRSSHTTYELITFQTPSVAPENKILWIFRSKSLRISPSDGLCESAPKPYSICKWSKTNQCVQIGFKKMERSSKSRGLYLPDEPQ